MSENCLLCVLIIIEEMKQLIHLFQQPKNALHDNLVIIFVYHKSILLSKYVQLYKLKKSYIGLNNTIFLLS